MIRKSSTQTLFIVIIIITLSAFITPAGAQGIFRVHIDYLNDQQFPFIEAFLSVSDVQGLPAKDLTISDFSISEDNQPAVDYEVTAIQNTQQPLAIALVVDTSGSMGSIIAPTPLQRAVEAAKSFVDQLTVQDQVAVIKFSDSPNVLQGLTADKNLVKSSLDTLKPEKNTALYDAIIEAVTILKSNSGRRIIVLITDGEDTSSIFNFDQAVDEASSWSIPIYPIGFGAVDQGELQRMAKLTGGSEQIQPNASELQSAFDLVLRLLREQYRIHYLSSFQADGKEHTLLATVNYQGGQQQDSRSFVARKVDIPVSLPDYQPEQVVGGLVPFKLVTDWPAPINDLDISVDGTSLPGVAAQLEYIWDSTATETEPGSHEFLFTLTDIAGNTGQTKVRLNVQPPISVHINQPSDGDVINNSVTISAEVSSIAGISIGKIEVSVDGKVISTPVTPPYEVKWDLAGVPAGWHTITVTTSDTIGKFLGEDEIKVDVQVGNYGWMIPLVILAVATLIIPLAIQRRKRMGRTVAPTVETRKVFLRELEGLNPDQVWPLGADEVRLGRKRDGNDVPLKGLSASRYHAVIRFDQNQYVIYCLNQNNPVIVNNIPIPQQYVLQPGDMIRLGETILTFEQ